MTTIEEGTDIDTEIRVANMTCGRCAAKVASALRPLPGVLTLDIDLRDRVVRVRHAATAITDAQLAAAVEGIGYRVAHFGPAA